MSWLSDISWLCQNDVFFVYVNRISTMSSNKLPVQSFLFSASLYPFLHMHFAVLFSTTHICEQVLSLNSSHGSKSTKRIQTKTFSLNYWINHIFNPFHFGSNLGPAELLLAIFTCICACFSNRCGLLFKVTNTQWV